MATGFTRPHRALRLRSRKRLARRWRPVLTRCMFMRLTVLPLDADPDAAVQHAAKMEDIVVPAGIRLEQVHHGYGIACWAVNRRALDRGHGIRTGLEDITVLPDGREARDNADLVAAAAGLIRAHVRPSHS
jgi:uncharacterized protein (DUF849 family)